MKWIDRSGDAGLVFQSKRTGAAVYDAHDANAGMDPDGGRYVIVCVHGRLVNVSAKRDARFIAGSRANLGDLCPTCGAGGFEEQAREDT